jgi:hypothetical protein
MTQRKPDRFERAVAKYEHRSMPDYDNHVLADHEVVTLLRQEYEWMRRMVKAEAQYHEKYYGLGIPTQFIEDG